MNDQPTVHTNSHSSGPSTTSSFVETTENGSCGEGTPGDASDKAWVNLRTSKDQYTREKLLECLDSGERLDDALQKNEQRWMIWRSRILAHPPNESFANWAKNIIHNGAPSDLGTLILLLGAGSDRKGSQNLIPLVATLITSDDDYTTTLSGIECSLLLSDYYCSIGQPRRAWLAIQRGLASAQLIVSFCKIIMSVFLFNIVQGLHRRSSSPIASGIMLLLHYENQFLSLLLGTARGIYFHCSIEYAREDIRFFKSEMGAICSKFLIGTQDQREPSLSLVLELDQQLQAMILAMPTTWKILQSEHSESAQLLLPDIEQDKILIQIRIQQLRTYLYLPLMLGSGSTQTIPPHMYEMSRIACLESSRELLRLYQFLSQQSSFENTLVDFMGFSAAMLIILTLLGCPKFRMGNESSRRTSNQDEQDWGFIETTISILNGRAESHDSKVIRQCLEVLRALSGARDPTDPIRPGCKYRLVVPFFGEILAQPGTKFGFISSSNNTTTPTKATTVHHSHPSNNMTSTSVLGSASNGSNAVHARNTMTISEFSGWDASRTIPELSEHAFNLLSQGLEHEENGNTFTEMSDVDLGLGMQPMRYNQQWQYLSDMDLNQDWLLLAEPSTSDLFIGNQ